MKTYNFSELSEQAKQKAIDQQRYSLLDPDSVNDRECIEHIEEMEYRFYEDGELSDEEPAHDNGITITLNRKS